MQEQLPRPSKRKYLGRRAETRLQKSRRNSDTLKQTEVKK